MSFRREEDDEVPEAEEDPLADEAAENAEEEEGEDLFGENMLQDYAERPELDQYDPEMLDDGEQEPLSVEGRLAAEEAMKERDARERRRRRGRDPDTPGLSLSPSSPAAGSSDAEAPSGSPVSGRRKRRRTQRSIDASPEEADGAEDLDEDVEEKDYDLTREDIGAGQNIDNRLERKIRLSFMMFLKKFTPEGAEEPIYPDKIKRMAEEAERHLDVNYTHVQSWSPQLALWIADYPVRILAILNETLMDMAERTFGTYKQIKETTDENELKVAVHSFPVKEPIRELCTKHLNRLVYVQGVATKRSGVLNQVKRLYLRCAKCNTQSGPWDVAEETDLKPGACIECQSRGPWRVDRQKTLYQNHQKITLQESPGSVDPGKMPRSKEVILTGDQVDSVRPGDELHLTGIYKCLYDAATNARTCFPVYRTEIQAVHVWRKGDQKMSQISDVHLQQILELARQPNIRERFISSMAPSIYGMHHVKTAIATSIMGGQRKETAGKHRIRGDINMLIVGDPGLAKSQFLKYVEKTIPRAVFTTGKGASGVGLTAAVTRDEHGEWCLEGGAMVLADDGICLIDEFDKMNDQDRTSIHEAMEQQTISISKAGIVATLQARCAVVAVANPSEGRYDPQLTFAQNVNLSDPILSRFDILCVLKDEADPIQDERLADHVVCSHLRSHPEATAEDKLVKPKLQQQQSVVEPIDQELLQKYIDYARKTVFPKVANIDMEKLANFYKDIRAEAFRSGGAPMTARHIDSMIRIAEANARMELRQHVTSKDMDNAIGLMLESFIQSQKHQVAEELRQKYRRYIAQATPLSDTFVALLERLFVNKIAMMRLNRPDAEAPAIETVSVDMEEVVREIERNDLDLEEAHTFMRTQRFKDNFRLEGEKLFRQI